MGRLPGLFRSTHVLVPKALGSSLLLSGCVLLDRAEAVYSTGSATIEEFRWLEGSPAPGVVIPVGEALALVEGSYDPDSSQESHRCR